MRAVDQQLVSKGVSATLLVLVGLGGIAAAEARAGSDGSTDRDDAVEIVLQSSRYSEEAGRAYWNEIQALIAACMEDRGFEFPRTEWWSIGPENPPTLGDVGDLDYVQEYGYGNAAAIRATDIEAALLALQPDPRADYLASLSDSARLGWHRALLGDGDLRDPSLPEGPDNPFEPDEGASGCRAHADAAFLEEHGGPETWPDELRREVGEALTAVELDERVIAAWSAWSGCMAGKGYQARNRDAAMSLAPSGIPTDGSMQRISVTDDAGQPVEIEVAAYDEAALTVAAETERRIATADYECDELHRVDQIRATVRRELLEDVVDKWSHVLSDPGDR